MARLARSALFGVGGAWLVTLFAGCIDEVRWVTPEGGEIYAFAMREDTPSILESETAALFRVEERVELPLRAPNDDERRELWDRGGLDIPYERLPWIRRGDVELQVDFTLSNLEAEPVFAAVTIDGFNEFHEYNPRAEIVNLDIIVDFSEWERSFQLEGGGRVVRTVREAEMDEVAVDLATVVNIDEMDPNPPSPNQIVYWESQSAIDARAGMYIPAVIPGLTGFRVGIRATRPFDDSMLAPRLVLEVAVRARDARGILAGSGARPWRLPAPALYGPADAPMPIEM